MMVDDGDHDDNPTLPYSTLPPSYLPSTLLTLPLLLSHLGLTAYSLHPGIVKSGLQGHDPTIMGSITRVGMHFIRMTPLEGALTSLYCATSPRAPEQAQGGYWEPVAKPNARAKEWLEDKATNGRLWEWSEAQMTRL